MQIQHNSSVRLLTSAADCFAGFCDDACFLETAAR